MDKSIIIIGASSGIGYCVARQFIDLGWRVGIAARRRELLNPLCELAPERVFASTIDVTAEDAPEKLNSLITEMGGVDTVFLISGVGKQNPNLNPDIEHNTILTNVVGFTRIVDTAFEYFRDSLKHGQIAVISSIAGTKGLGVAASYSATKRYQNTYIEALEQLAHIKHLPICFTDIRPGFVATPLLDDSHKYPLMLKAESVARIIVKAIIKKKHVKVIDWRYAIMTRLWGLIPRAIWRNLKISN